MHTQVEIGLAATVEFYSAQGPLKSCTLTLRDAANSVIASAVSCTIGTATQSISTGTAGASSVTVSSTTGFTVGKRYWIASSGGRTQEIRLIDKSSTVLYLDQATRFLCTSGTISDLHRAYYALSTTHTASRKRGAMLEWRAVLNSDSSVLPVVLEPIDIVKRPFVLNVREEDLEQIAAQYGEAIGSLRGLDSWTQGAERRLWVDLERRGYYPDLLRDRTILRDAACFAMLEARAAGNEEQRSYWRQRYDETMQSVYESKTLWYDEDDDLDTDGTADGTEALNAETGRKPVNYASLA